MKNKIKYLILASGIIFLTLSALSLVIYNFNFGIVICAGVSCALIWYGVFFDKLITFRLLTYCILTICAVSASFMLFFCLYGKTDNVSYDEDAVIVLGAAVRGERVSNILARRLDKAVEYNAKNPEAVIVVSGGQGPQEDITEAVAMERYLIEKGVPSDLIIQEGAASSTYENLLFSKEILDNMFDDEYKTVVITNDFHIYRASRLAKKLGYNITHYHAATSINAVPASYSRECLAIVKMWVMGR